MSTPLKSDDFPYLKSLEIELTDFWSTNGGDTMNRNKTITFDTVEKLHTIPPLFYKDELEKRRFSYDLIPKFKQMYEHLLEEDRYDYTYTDEKQKRDTGYGEVTRAVIYKLEYTEEGKRVRDEKKSSTPPGQ